MSRKKINPSRVPVSVSEAEARRLVEQEADRMCTYGWTLILTALADRWDATSESIVGFCEAVTNLAVEPPAGESVTVKTATLEALTGKAFPFHTVVVTNIRTKRDLDRMLRLTNENTINSMFALAADTALVNGIMGEDDIRALFQKARLLADSLFEGRVSLQDLLGVLEDEFGVLIVEDRGGAHIKTLDDG